MKVSVNPGLTLNVGENTSISANELTFDVDSCKPVNPTLGDFRFIPTQIASAVSAQLQWYDPDKKEWVNGLPTLYDIYLAKQIIKEGRVDANSMVYYRLINEVVDNNHNKTRYVGVAEEIKDKGE